MQFEVDNRIEMNAFWLSEGPLSRIYLKNEAHFPWIVLVPRQENVEEIYQLSKQNQYILMDEIASLSKIMKEVFNPDKLNVSALGNMVPQLHIHLVARFNKDSLWPHSIWQPAMKSTFYSDEKGATLVSNLKEKIIAAGLSNKIENILSSVVD